MGTTEMGVSRRVANDVASSENVHLNAMMPRTSHSARHRCVHTSDGMPSAVMRPLEPE